MGAVAVLGGIWEIVFSRAGPVRKGASIGSSFDLGIPFQGGSVIECSSLASSGDVIAAVGRSLVCYNAPGADYHNRGGRRTARAYDRPGQRQ